jgi:redox-sensitive bicupin YhaK (pirin superfamily)
VSVNGKELKAGDGAVISDESEVRIEALKPSEVLLFDLA